MKILTKVIAVSSTFILISGQASACNSSFCVNPEMPLLSQASTRLASAISRLERDSSIKKDTGWCVPVAATMSFAGSLKKSKNMSYSSSKLNNMRNYNVHWNSHINAGTFSDSIHYVGELMRTNWRKGGTSTRSSDKAYKSIYNSIRGNVTKNYVAKSTKHSSYNLNYFKTLFRGKYPAATLIIKKTDRRRKFLSGHAIALHGYEGSTLKIFDPWGRIYNVSVSSTGSRSYPKISHVKGTRGAVEYYSRGSNYASLTSFASFSVQDKASRSPSNGRYTRPPVNNPRDPRNWRRNRFLP
ncbi:MAG: hypothetical protein VX341_14095 [Bdellovibrionota bacterium]|nr:hypothetical protein [Bdellovibrionota bacterium]